MASRRKRVAIAAVLIALGAPATGIAKPPVVRPSQELATLLQAHRVVSMPRAHPRTIGTVPAWAPITGGATVLPVVDHRTTADGVRWLRVRLPGRPNSHKGWIVKSATRRTTTSWHLVVRTSLRRLDVYRHGRRVRSFALSVGTPSTPTPHGLFFVEESVQMLPGAAGGPYALALSARSNVLQVFNGGPGQIALHGVANLGGPIGAAVSHGCLRLRNVSIRWLAFRIGPGVPVTIRP